MFSNAQLSIHKGGYLCEYEELAQVPTPKPEGRWHPVSHVSVLDTVSETLTASGYLIADRRLALARDGKRFFGTLTLTQSLDPNHSVALAVGVRNSIDKSFPLGFCAGNRVFVCDNLAFRAELLVKNRHTRFGQQRFQNSIADAVRSLASFSEAERNRIEVLQNWELTDDQALALMTRSVEQQLISPILLPKILSEWRTPQFDYGTGERPTAWKLLNCYTTVLRSKVLQNPYGYAGQTIRLNHLLSPPEFEKIIESPENPVID